MPWRLGNLVIEAERIRTMEAAYYEACAQLGPSPAPDSITEMLVTKIVDLGMASDVDPDRLCQLAVAYFTADPTRVAPECPS